MQAHGILEVKIPQPGFLSLSYSVLSCSVTHARLFSHSPVELSSAAAGPSHADPLAGSALALLSHGAPALLNTDGTFPCGTKGNGTLDTRV